MSWFSFLEYFFSTRTKDGALSSGSHNGLLSDFLILISLLQGTALVLPGPLISETTHQLSLLSLLENQPKNGSVAPSSYMKESSSPKSVSRTCHLALMPPPPAMIPHRLQILGENKIQNLVSIHKFDTAS